MLGHVEPVGGDEELDRRAISLDIDDRTVRVIHLDDLIAIKRYLGRPKDREALLQLEAIRTVREEK